MTSNICISPNKSHTCFFELLAVPGQVEVVGMACREEMFVKGDHMHEAEPLVFLGCLFSRVLSGNTLITHKEMEVHSLLPVESLHTDTIKKFKITLSAQLLKYMIVKKSPGSFSSM